ncbi:acetyl-coenzyme A synthetase N-terminal domain-containing protein, partial [Mameliella alba]
MSTTYPPSEEQVKRAHVDAARYDEMYARSVSDPEGFWAEQAQRLDWMKQPSEIKNTDFTLGQV